jgi:hypothetical protein
MIDTEYERRSRIAKAILKRGYVCGSSFVIHLQILVKLTHILKSNPPWLQGTLYDLNVPEGRKQLMQALDDFRAQLKQIIDNPQPHHETKLIKGHSIGRKVADKEPPRWKERE